MKIIDYNDHIENGCFWFVADVGELKDQHFNPNFWEILENEMTLGFIYDFWSTEDVNYIAIDTGQETVTWPDSNRISKKRMRLLTFQEYISDHMNEDVLKRFLKKSFDGTTGKR